MRPVFRAVRSLVRGEDEAVAHRQLAQQRVRQAVTPRGDSKPDWQILVDVARRIMHFYAHESCGWCIPCREGTSWLKKMLDRFHAGFGRPEDIDLIDQLSKNMLGRTFCPLGDAAAMPTISIVTKFRNEFEEHLQGKCAYKSAESLVGSR